MCVQVAQTIANYTSLASCSTELDHHINAHSSYVYIHTISQLCSSSCVSEIDIKQCTHA